MSSPVYSAFDDELTVVELCEKIINLFEGIDWEQIKGLATQVLKNTEDIERIETSITTLSQAVATLQSNTSDLPAIRSNIEIIGREIESMSNLLNTKASKTEDNDFTGFNYFMNEIMLTHLLDKDGDEGTAGQYLTPTTDGVKWASLPTPEGGIDNVTLSLDTNTDGDPIVKLEYEKDGQSFSSPVSFDKDTFEIVNNHMRAKGGTNVVANPTEGGTTDLEKLQVGETVYNIPSGGGGGGGKLYEHNITFIYSTGDITANWALKGNFGLRLYLTSPTPITVNTFFDAVKSQYAYSKYALDGIFAYHDAGSWIRYGIARINAMNTSTNRQISVEGMTLFSGPVSGGSVTVGLSPDYWYAIGSLDPQYISNFIDSVREV